MGHPVVRVQGPEWDGNSNHAGTSLSRPNLPDEDGDDKNSSQDKEGKDPKGHQDGCLLQGVTVIWDRETVMAEGCHSPWAPGGPYCKLLDTAAPQPHTGRGQETCPITLSHTCSEAGSCLQAVPTLAHHLQVYSLMGSGLGAWEGSSARLSRLVSVVVSSLATVAGSGRTGETGITHPKSWAAPQRPTERSKEGRPCAPGVSQAQGCRWGASSALGALLCPEVAGSNPQMAAAQLQPAMGLGDALPPCSSVSHRGASFWMVQRTSFWGQL